MGAGSQDTVPGVRFERPRSATSVFSLLELSTIMENSEQTEERQATMRDASETTPAQPVNWEAVKCLALVVGVREAARRMGISEETAKKRCTREKWLDSPEARAANKLAVQQRAGITMSPQASPAALIQQEVAMLGQKSRLSLARGLVRAAEHVESMDGQEILEDAQNVKAVTQTAAILHNWDRNSAHARVRLELLGKGNGSDIAIDVESQVVTDTWDDQGSI